jgi:hypothetical protein
LEPPRGPPAELEQNGSRRGLARVNARRGSRFPRGCRVRTVTREGSSPMDMSGRAGGTERFLGRRSLSDSRVLVAQGGPRRTVWPRRGESAGGGPRANPPGAAGGWIAVGDRDEQRRQDGLHDPSRGVFSFKLRGHESRHVGNGESPESVPSTHRCEAVFCPRHGFYRSRHEPSSLVVVITVSPCWYIRGVTPRRRIRRW